jgi:single-strand DNA-binding protein
MALPTLTGTARLTGDPDLKYANSGMAICKIHLAFNSRKKNPAGEWVDGESYFVGATAFKDLAEHIAESLAKGVEVHVSGRMKTREWTTDQGEKRSMPELLIDEIGPSLRYATAKPVKAQRGQGGQGGAGQYSAPAPADPWSAPAGVGAAGGYSDQPPFFADPAEVGVVVRGGIA